MEGERKPRNPMCRNNRTWRIERAIESRSYEPLKADRSLVLAGVIVAGRRNVCYRVITWPLYSQRERHSVAGWCPRIISGRVSLDFDHEFVVIKDALWGSSVLAKSPFQPGKIYIRQIPNYTDLKSMR